MVKKRVYELAKEFGVDSKTVLERLKSMGEFVKSASSTVEAPVVRRLQTALASTEISPKRHLVQVSLLRQKLSLKLSRRLNLKLKIRHTVIL